MFSNFSFLNFILTLISCSEFWNLKLAHKMKVNHNNTVGNHLIVLLRTNQPSTFLYTLFSFYGQKWNSNRSHSGWHLTHDTLISYRHFIFDGKSSTVALVKLRWIFERNICELNCVRFVFGDFILAVKCLVRVVIHLKGHKNSFYTTFPIKWMQFIYFLFTLKHSLWHIHITHTHTQTKPYIVQPYRLKTQDAAINFPLYFGKKENKIRKSYALSQNQKENTSRISRETTWANTEGEKNVSSKVKSNAVCAIIQRAIAIWDCSIP